MELERLEILIREEIKQRSEEGCETFGFLERWEKSRGNKEALMDLYQELSSLPIRKDFPYYEPSSLEEIKEERPDGPRRIPVSFTDDLIRDKVMGGWIGRCIGCMLGKPVEGWDKDRIRAFLLNAGEYPLQYYFPEESKDEGGNPVRLWKPCTRGNISRVERDDDIDYTILNLHILETKGSGFTTEDVGETWLSLLPYKQVYTAEREAYRNLVNDIRPPESAVYLNPYREWIGAQIRADCFGYVSPGWPELGAELAYRDAALSHVKNGIYGEMFVAAMISAAYVARDAEEVIRIGLSEIPERSRLSEAIRDVLEMRGSIQDWEEALDVIYRRYGHYHPVHTINNAAIVAASILYGNGDFERAITMAVMGGLDTDCNGATVGSIMGILVGAEGIPERWKSPLNDTIRSFVLGFDGSRITDLSERTFALLSKFHG